MSLPKPPTNEPDRRAQARRTVWTLALVAVAIYGYFIVKTFLYHAGSNA